MMHIVIYAGGIPFDGNTIKERSLGGSESAAYYVGQQLADRGHKVVMFTDITEAMECDGVSYVSIGERTQPKPMGVNWHFYCENTPHEVNIIQRVPYGFACPIQSKINLWWAHDIALKRNADAFMCGQWQMNRMLPVSHWFKEQIAAAWNVPPEKISPVHNGVDYALFEQFELKDNSMHPPAYVSGDGEAVPPGDINLIYSSRPERGLDNLVSPGGIMEQLLEKAPHVKLTVCGYEHPVPQLDDMYTFLRERIDQLPNCEHVGSLTKNDLVELMCTKADVWCYPTAFEEVSCITAMEAMAAGLTIMTTNIGALPETIGDYPNAVIFNADKGVDISKFVDRLSSFNNIFRRKPHRPYTWERVADEFEEIIRDEFKVGQSVDSLSRHFLRHSDIVSLDYLEVPGIPKEVLEQLPFYDFRHNQKDYAEHYANGTEEMYDGPDFQYEPPEFVQHPRFQQIFGMLKDYPKGSKFIDYGCAHGHFTNYLAKAFPDFFFTGIDVSPKAIDVAVEKAKEMQLENVGYFVDDWLGDEPHDSNSIDPVDCIILGEILEHVPDPGFFMDVVRLHVNDVPVIMTTPLGPWEEMSYEKEGEKRFHIHHFERSDLMDMFDHHTDFNIDCLSAGSSLTGELLGWYVTTFTFTEGEQSCKPINYPRKLAETVPRQTVSFCVIMKNAESTLKKMLDSVCPYVDEVIIGVDETTTDKTRQMIAEYAPKNRAPWLPIQSFDIKSPVEIGFDAARNFTLEKAMKDWVLWCDADEELISGEKLPKLLRNNAWDGYGIPQHHFAVEPLGVLSTDFPVRLFRNKPGIEFVGVVHEHPTKRADINEGVGKAWVVHELHFAHSGYTTEPIRRGRFQRNIDLMARDRTDNPDRILGKFLWIRDLALMCRFDLETNGGMITPQMRQRAEVGLKLWEETIDKDGKHPQSIRMITSQLEFYNTLTNVLDEGFDFKIKLASGLNGSTPALEQVPELSARFRNKRHLDKFLSIVVDSEVDCYDEKYL